MSTQCGTWCGNCFRTGGMVRGRRSAPSLPFCSASFIGGNAEVSRRYLKLFEERFPARPGFVARFGVLVALLRIVRLARTHESVPGAFVNHRLVFFAGRFH